jgi:hypothetical protein
MDAHRSCPDCSRWRQRRRYLSSYIAYMRTIYAIYEDKYAYKIYAIYEDKYAYVYEDKYAYIAVLILLYTYI